MAKWKEVDYDHLPHDFYGRGIISPCGRFLASWRFATKSWGVLDLHTSEYADGFRFRRDAVQFIGGRS
jgi:hypothetical protein